MYSHALQQLPRRPAPSHTLQLLPRRHVQHGEVALRRQILLPEMRPHCESVRPADERREVETPRCVQADHGIGGVGLELGAEVLPGVPDCLAGFVAFDPGADSAFGFAPLGGVFDFAGEEPGLGGYSEEGVDGCVSCHEERVGGGVLKGAADIGGARRDHVEALKDICRENRHLVDIWAGNERQPYRDIFTIPDALGASYWECRTLRCNELAQGLLEERTSLGVYHKRC